MKKLILILAICLLSGALFGQAKNRSGASFGDERTSGTNINVLDSLTYVGTMYFMYRIGDTSMVYIPYDNRVDPTEISIPKDPDVSTKTADYTLVLTDGFDFIYMNLGTVDTLFVPTNVSVAFPLKTQITIINLQAGATTISPIAGVTLNSVGDVYDIKVNGMVTLLKYSANVWMLTGAVE